MINAGAGNNGNKNWGCFISNKDNNTSTGTIQATQKLTPTLLCSLRMNHRRAQSNGRIDQGKNTTGVNSRYHHHGCEVAKNSSANNSGVCWTRPHRYAAPAWAAAGTAQPANSAKAMIGVPITPVGPWSVAGPQRGE